MGLAIGVMLGILINHLIIRPIERKYWRKKCIENGFIRGVKQMTNEQAERCYECTAYGNDYYTDDEGKLACACVDCPFNPLNGGDEDDE